MLSSNELRIQLRDKCDPTVFKFLEMIVEDFHSMNKKLTSCMALMEQLSNIVMNITTVNVQMKKQISQLREGDGIWKSEHIPLDEQQPG